MAVKSKKNENNLILELDNGDLTKLDAAMEKWHFKDYQSLLRFVVSMLILNETTSFTLQMDNRQQDVVPSADLLKEKRNYDGSK